MTPSFDPTTLYESCLQQVERERRLLTALEGTLRELRAALRAGRSDGMARALELQQTLASQAEAGTEQRLGWRTELARALGLAPDRVGLTLLAGLLPALPQQNLLAARDELRRRVEEVAQVKQASVSLLRAYVAALQRFFLDVTRGGEAAGCYNRGGAGRPPAYGSIVTMQG